MKYVALALVVALFTLTNATEFHKKMSGPHKSKLHPIDNNIEYGRGIMKKPLLPHKKVASKPHQGHHLLGHRGEQHWRQGLGHLPGHPGLQHWDHHSVGHHNNDHVQLQHLTNDDIKHRETKDPIHHQSFKLPVVPLTRTNSPKTKLHMVSLTHAKNPIKKTSLKKSFPKKKIVKKQLHSRRQKKVVHGRLYKKYHNKRG